MLDTEPIETTSTAPLPRRSSSAGARTVGGLAIAPLPPVMSAQRLLSTTQGAALVIAVAGLVAMVLVRAVFGVGLSTPGVLHVVLVAMMLVNLLNTAYGTLLAILGWRGAPSVTAARGVATGQQDPQQWPRYSVLVPLHREDAVLPRLITELAALDYPGDRLQILLLIEDDDAATRGALAELGALDDRFTVLGFRPTLPRSKPKACNIGLQWVDGEFCTIYDAEDRPAPDQLRRAVLAFRSLPDTVVCLQAELEHWNATTNWLTASFAAEYALRFGLALPALDRLGWPVPLGGNSNHFRTAALCELGAWDPCNLTEDADLGMRIARRGWEVRSLASTTAEEANCEVGNWLRQRSRWIKGHLQTWLVHSRHPVRLLRELGLQRWCSLHLGLGLPAIAALLNPPLWVIAAVTPLTDGTALREFLPSSHAYLVGAVALGAAYAVTVLTLAAACSRRVLPKTVIIATVTVPLYWVLLSIAAYKALVQLLRPSRRHYWELTRHGLVS